LTKRRIVVYTLHYHVERSPASRVSFVAPLAPYIDVQMATVNSSDWKTVLQSQPLIFFDKAPNPEVLAHPEAEIVWAPMFDGHTRHGVSWWRQWNHYNIKFISYSKKHTQILREAGLEVFYIQFFNNPKEYSQVSWEGKLNAMYWNRHGLIRRPHIEELCGQLQISELFYRSKTDSSVSSASNFQLPEKLEDTNVIDLDEWMDYQTYLDYVSRSHLFIAPRFFEGIGLTFTEAMASGCVVLANDSFTMSDYIVHGETGLFLPYSTPMRYFARAKSKIEQRLGLDIPQMSPLLNYDWKNILDYNLERISRNAIAYFEEGYRQFQKQIPDLVNFILDE